MKLHSLSKKARHFLPFLSTVLLTTATAVATAAPLLVLKEEGSFHIGGQSEFRDPNSTSNVNVMTSGMQPGDIWINHMFVQYHIPYTPFGPAKLPVVMMHGGGHTAKTWETTPDGREGWYNTWLRRGYPVYAVDAPNRGRSGYDPTHRFRAIRGTEPATAMEIGDIYSKQGAWISFRFGPTYGVKYPGARFPFDYLDIYTQQLVPSYRNTPQNGFIAAALSALADKLGQSIFLGHSTGGNNVLTAVTLNPTKIKLVATIEPSGFPASSTRAISATVPTFQMIGDNRTLGASGTFHNDLVTLGGDSTLYSLPANGIFGNSHMMMMEDNSEALADIIVNWIKAHGY